METDEILVDNQKKVRSIQMWTKFIDAYAPRKRLSNQFKYKGISSGFYRKTMEEKFRRLTVFVSISVIKNVKIEDNIIHITLHFESPLV